MSDNTEIDYNKILELIEIGLLSIAIFSIAIIKLLSFCDKKKTNREQIKLLKAQVEFNNKIPIYNLNESFQNQVQTTSFCETSSSNSSSSLEIK